jgi:hypothetical protein
MRVTCFGADLGQPASRAPLIGQCGLDLRRRIARPSSPSSTPSPCQRYRPADRSPGGQRWGDDGVRTSGSRGLGYHLCGSSACHSPSEPRHAEAQRRGQVLHGATRVLRHVPSSWRAGVGVPHEGSNDDERRPESRDSRAHGQNGRELHHSQARDRAGPWPCTGTSQPAE